MGCSGGASSDEKAAQAQTRAIQQQQQQFATNLMKIYQTQLAQQQTILKPLISQLQTMATNPQGFGTAEFAALQAKIVNDTSGQYSSAAKSEAQSFAVSNEAGLTSGAEEAIQAGLKAQAGESVAEQSVNLTVANEQLKQEQQRFAQSGLAQISGTLGSQADATAGMGGSNLGAAGATANEEFQQASTIYNQGSMWQNILGGVIGAGTNFLTGGLSSVLQGNSFLSGAGKAIAPTVPTAPAVAHG